jgi:nucleolar protein 15
MPRAASGAAKVTSKADAFRSQADVVAVEAARGGRGAALAKQGELSSVIYLGHVPHGFYEEQMTGFFAQFGVVKAVRLARSKKTTRSKGFAYIQFEDPKVAIVAANTMDQYMLFGNTLVSHVLKQGEVHANLFKGADAQFKRVPWRDIAKARQNAPRDEAQLAKIHTRLCAKDSKKRARLEAAGITYDFEGYSVTATLTVKDGNADKETDVVVVAGRGGRASSRGGKKAVVVKAGADDVAVAAAAAAATSRSPSSTALMPAPESDDAVELEAPTSGKKRKSPLAKSPLPAKEPAAQGSAAKRVGGSKGGQGGNGKGGQGGNGKASAETAVVSGAAAAGDGEAAKRSRRSNRGGAAEDAVAAQAAPAAVAAADVPAAAAAAAAKATTPKAAKGRAVASTTDEKEKGSGAKRKPASAKKK